MSNHPRQERTFVMVKPDGVRRGLTGEIIRRLEQRGLKVIALVMDAPTREKFDGHYPKDPKWITRLGEKTLATYQKYGFDPMKELATDKAEIIGPMVRGWLLDFMMSCREDGYRRRSRGRHGAKNCREHDAVGCRNGHYSW